MSYINQCVLIRRTLRVCVILCLYLNSIETYWQEKKTVADLEWPQITLVTRFQQPFPLNPDPGLKLESASAFCGSLLPLYPTFKSDLLLFLSEFKKWHKILPGFRNRGSRIPNGFAYFHRAATTSSKKNPPY